MKQHHAHAASRRLRGGFAKTLLALALLLPAQQLYATNGLRLIGSGPINLGLAGAGVAAPKSASTIYINPAGMNDIGNQVDLNFTFGFPSTRLDTHLAPAGNPAAIQTEGIDSLVLLPNGAITFGFMENNRLSVGIGSFLVSGFQVNYPVSRVNSLITANRYDRSGRYGDLKIIPAASYRILDNLSLGVGIDINYAFINLDSAVLTSPTLAPSQGGNRTDSALGIGARIGLLYRPIEMLRLGLTYSTPQYFQEFEQYADILQKSADQPQELQVGAALTPAQGLLLLGDFRWINWSGVGLLGDKLAQGGLNWRDQFVFMLAAEYDFKPAFDVPLQLRMGYNYGRSPIYGPGVFANTLSPTIGEHHLSGGLSYEVNKHIGIDVAYVRDFENTVTDDGTGNPAFTGASYSVSGNILSLGVRGSWGKSE